MTDVEQMMLEALAAIREETGNASVTLGKIEVHLENHEDRIKTLEGFKAKLLMAVMGSGLLGAGGGTLARILGL